MRSLIIRISIVGSLLLGLTLAVALTPVPESFTPGTISYAAAAPRVERHDVAAASVIPQVPLLSTTATMCPSAPAQVGSSSAILWHHRSSASSVHSYGGGNTAMGASAHAAASRSSQQASGAHILPPLLARAERPAVYGVGATLSDTEIAMTPAIRRAGPPGTGGGSGNTERPDIHVPEPLGDAVLPLLLFTMAQFLLRIYRTRKKQS